MGQVIKVGENLPLVAHLECPDQSDIFFVEATVRRPDRSQITGSPKQLTDEGDGLFFDDTLSMPNESFLTVTYKVFNDVGLTIESDEYCPVTSVISQQSSGSGTPIIVNTPDRIGARVRDSKVNIKMTDKRPGRVKVDDDSAKVGKQESKNNINTQDNQSKVRTS